MCDLKNFKYQVAIVSMHGFKFIYPGYATFHFLVLLPVEFVKSTHLCLTGLDNAAQLRSFLWGIPNS